MDRINELINYDPTDIAFHSSNLIHAYCFCLTPEQTCELFKSIPRENKRLLDKALKKICSDIESEMLPCHENLLGVLEKELTSVISKHRQSIGYYLTNISDCAPADTRKRIQTLFLESKYIGIRKRGYKSITRNKDDSQDILLEAWNTFNDAECAWTITNTFPTNALVPIRKNIVNTFSEGWQYSRLYLKIGKEHPQLLKELRDLDEISFCYVLAKLNKKLTTTDAKKIIDNNLCDERIGLLIWALGRLRLWEALQYIELQLKHN